MQKKLGHLSLFTMLALAGCVDANSDTGTTADDEDPAAAPARIAAPNAPVQTAEELARMSAFLAKRTDKAIVKTTLRTKAGRRVDCIDIDKQPALRGQPLEAPPRVLDAPALTAAERSELGVRSPSLYSLDQKSAARCPSGTVPRPEVTMEDLRRFATLDDYFAKEPAGSRGATGPATSTKSPASTEEGLEPPHVGPTASHQYAHAYRQVTNWGAETWLSKNDFATERDDEFSLGQIWVYGGTGNDLQTLEVGIQRYHQLYGDDKPHVFIYSTRGNYQNGTGCYNNSCDDFVVTSSSWVPGEEVTNLSVIGGTQRSMYIHWTKAGDTGSWWLTVGDEIVGYYPRNLYDAIRNRAAGIDFGGEIIDKQTDGRHTKTNMGSGRPASAGWQQAAYMRKLRYHDSNPSGNAVTWHEATGLSTWQNDAACYSIDLNSISDDGWKNYFYYGGGGYANPACL